MEDGARRRRRSVSSKTRAMFLTQAGRRRASVMMADIGEWNAFNDVYCSYFKAGAYPARSAFGTSGLAFNARVEVECIACTDI
jgi:2-iminobutanoate/2-iminopropanoate deaminase